MTGDISNYNSVGRKLEALGIHLQSSEKTNTDYARASLNPWKLIA